MISNSPKTLYDNLPSQKIRYVHEQGKSSQDIGLKATGPRLKILDLFERSSARHLSAEDVYRLLLAEEVDIGLTAHGLPRACPV